MLFISFRQFSTHQRPSETAGDKAGGWSLPDDKGRQIGSKKQHPGLYRGAERGREEGAWQETPWRRARCAERSPSPLLEQVTASSELSRREVTTPGMRGPAQPHKRLLERGRAAQTSQEKSPEPGLLLPLYPADRSGGQHSFCPELPPPAELSPCAFPQREKPDWSSCVLA